MGSETDALLEKSFISHAVPHQMWKGQTSDASVIPMSIRPGRDVKRVTMNFHSRNSSGKTQVNPFASFGSV